MRRQKVMSPPKEVVLHTMKPPKHPGPPKSIARPSSTPPILVSVPSIVEPSRKVPLWTVEDVVSWVRKTGFSDYAAAFNEVGVDGDLLLQLSDSEIRDDIGITNGILRKRFMRELKNLKKNADYSSCDGGQAANFLAKIGSDYKIYAYNFTTNDLKIEFMRKLNEADLNDMLNDAGIDSVIHKHKIIEAVLNFSDDESTDGSLYSDPSIDVYLSYPKNSGAELSSLIKMQLQLRGLKVYADSHDSADLNETIISNINEAKHFVLVMPPEALNSCIEDVNCQDRLHKEIVAAVKANINIIPVTSDFQWPEQESLPEDMRCLPSFNSIRWVHDYQDACIDKLERFVRGESFLRVDSPYYGRQAGGRGSRGGSRGDSGRSTPTQCSPLLIQKFLRNRTISNDSALG